MRVAPRPWVLPLSRTVCLRPPVIVRTSSPEPPSPTPPKRPSALKHPVATLREKFHDLGPRSRQAMKVGAAMLPIVVSATGLDVPGCNTLITLELVALSALGLHEYFSATFKDMPRLRKALVAAGTLYASALALPGGLGHLALVSSVMAATFIAILPRGRSARPFVRAGIAYAGLGWICFLMAHLHWMLNLAHGGAWLLTACIANFAGDTAAMLVGRAFGRTKLAPKLSPNKTVEGFYGQLIGATLAALATTAIFLPITATALDVTVIGLSAGLLGTVGGLMNSAWKRRLGLKDSGHALGRMGGLIDRVDGLLLSGAAAYWYLYWLGV